MRVILLKLNYAYMTAAVLLLSACAQTQIGGVINREVGEDVSEEVAQATAEVIVVDIEESGYIPNADQPDQLSPAEDELSEALEPSQEVALIVEAEQEEMIPEQTVTQLESVNALCREIGEKLGSVNVDDCLLKGLQFGGAYTLNDRPLVIRDYFAEDVVDDSFKILIMGGIHGDEYSSISIMFKWMSMLEESKQSRDFHWRFAPTVNPDGLLSGQAIRQNANGVDLNRNFPSRDWGAMAKKYWEQSTGSNPRRYPGTGASSEVEVQWIVEQIEVFDPDVIVSVHAPYHLLDFDGPSDAPEKIGELYLHQLGVYPGSLGNYAGLDKGIPVVTLELPSAGIMPTPEQVEVMWKDLLVWLVNEEKKPSS